jgi:hypothetical protein
MGKTDIFLSTLPFNPWAILATWLISVLNKTSLRAHTELELDVLGIPGELVKYVVHSSKRKKLKIIYFSSHKLPKQQSTNFCSKGILGVKAYTCLYLPSGIVKWKSFSILLFQLTTKHHGLPKQLFAILGKFLQLQ